MVLWPDVTTYCGEPIGIVPHMPVARGDIRLTEDAMLYSLAHLESEKLKAIQKLEKEIGSPVVALEGVDAETVVLPDEKLRKLQELESRLGVVLVAVKPH